MQVRASVKCTVAGHARENQAGVVIADDGKSPPEKLTVRWDTDLADEAMAAADLVQLGEN